jgi:ribosomal-protein-alanine N-acetyltransferase
MFPLLRTPRAVLKLATEADAPLILDYFRTSGHRYDPPANESLLNLEHWQQHAARLRNEFRAGTSCRFFVFSPDHKQVRGTVDLVRIARGVRHDCTLGYAIAKEYEGTGLMYECVSEAIYYAFTTLNLHRIEATHALDNPRSRRLLERLGFVSVGTIPQFHRSGERWLDSHLMTLINDNWRAP